MARPISRFSQTLQDYGTPGPGSTTGGEKSTWGAWIDTLASGNFVTQTGLVSSLLSAVLAITKGGQSGMATIAVSDVSTVAITDPLAQRENKWLVRYHDNIDGTKFSLEIPTADLTLLTTGNEFADLDGTEFAAFVAAFQAVVVSPDDPSHDVLVDSIQFVGRRS